ncbi:hypothetical protein H5410_056606 [Solanum commersonii]|uniref:Uncharacterized protein n=1 Tax=Solanum commersonii TaxID=4109 RepID=A0A9J5WN61_SOLCO|nr:hypothetical protein H5410_056606 [Solanum commersonii]
MDVRQDLFCGPGWSRWANRPIFKVKPSLERSMDLLVIQIFDGVGPDGKTDPYTRSNKPWSVHGSFGDPDFRRHFCKFFLWKFVKTLAMELVGPDGQTVLFLWSNDPQSWYTPWFADFRVL